MKRFVLYSISLAPILSLPQADSSYGDNNIKTRWPSHAHAAFDLLDSCEDFICMLQSYASSAAADDGPREKSKRGF